MAFIQYKRNVLWDSTLSDLGFCDVVGAPGEITQSLVVSANKTTTGAPAATAGYFTPGCLITNLVSGVIYSNTGSTASPVWTVVEVGSPLSLPDGQIFVGNGSNVPTPRTLSQDVVITDTAVATVEGLRSKNLDSTTFASPFTNSFIQYSGNGTTGWIVAEHLSATASAGVATMPGSLNGTNCIVTTESLTTAAGSTVTLQVNSGQFTSSTNFIPHIRRGTATQGTAIIESWTQTGGSVTFTIKNIDASAAFNGTFIVSMVGF